jgi:hypothetical protein
LVLDLERCNSIQKSRESRDIFAPKDLRNPLRLSLLIVSALSGQEWKNGVMDKRTV